MSELKHQDEMSFLEKYWQVFVIAFGIIWVAFFLSFPAHKG